MLSFYRRFSGKTNVPIAVLTAYTEQEYEPYDSYSWFYPAMSVSVCFSDTALYTLSENRVRSVICPKKRAVLCGGQNGNRFHRVQLCHFVHLAFCTESKKIVCVRHAYNAALCHCSYDSTACRCCQVLFRLRADDSRRSVRRSPGFPFRCPAGGNSRRPRP